MHANKASFDQTMHSSEMGDSLVIYWIREVIDNFYYNMKLNTALLGHVLECFDNIISDIGIPQQKELVISLVVMENLYMWKKVKNFTNIYV